MFYIPDTRDGIISKLNELSKQIEIELDYESNASVKLLFAYYRILVAKLVNE